MGSTHYKCGVKIKVEGSCPYVSPGSEFEGAIRSKANLSIGHVKCLLGTDWTINFIQVDLAYGGEREGESEGGRERRGSGSDRLR
jgi:hypothetical protein